MRHCSHSAPGLHLEAFEDTKEVGVAKTEAAASRAEEASCCYCRVWVSGMEAYIAHHHN